jgi:hypothetical protein
MDYNKDLKKGFYHKIRHKNHLKIIFHCDTVLPHCSQFRETLKERIYRKIRGQAELN